MFQQGSSYLAAATYPYPDTIDQDIIASRQALQSTARTISAESSSRLASMAHHSPEHTMQALSNRHELHRNASISAAELSHPAYSSPNTPFYHQQATYQPVSVPATTMAAPSYFPKYQQAEYSQGPIVSSNYVYSSVEQPLSSYGQYQMTPDGYYDTYLPTSTMPMAYAQQDVDMTSSTYDATPLSHAHLSLPAMESNTAFSTPDLPANQQFPEPKTPPPPTSSNSSGESVRDEDDLVGVGLYDEPLDTSYWDESLSSSVDPILYPYPPTRKGLKLEETLDPSTLNCSDMDADGDEEEEEDEQPRMEPSVKDSDESNSAGGQLFQVDEDASYNSAQVSWTAAPPVMLNSYAAFPGSYQNVYPTMY
ncbi:hypothetical protein MGYG_07646 [Nannizzia gypsea CBS 118893]|uniref:Uncharacterized protein n=1 Tax=Arthroderma gypseum (strain ATCC MYA-4604 / CBS 118893) TaxID=535722 RepID=E4V3R6_ARTGP|nr:hypothetical protein MGYG_07646 [Nannizzia gypsea CBS 118893]EFR04640.1 hypothetical protein MGYG_07646 [Nannizzia gypsea CBS 118893]